MSLPAPPRCYCPLCCTVYDGPPDATDCAWRNCEGPACKGKRRCTCTVCGARFTTTLPQDPHLEPGYGHCLACKACPRIARLTVAHRIFDVTSPEQWATRCATYA